MGISYLSSLLSLEFLRELLGAGERLEPTEALLGVGMTAEMGQAGQGAGTGDTSTSMRVLGNQQGFAPPREFPRAVARSGLPATSHPPSMARVSPKRTLKTPPGCPGTPRPYLSPDGLFCAEEEEEVVEDLESAEALLAGQSRVREQ